MGGGGGEGGRKYPHNFVLEAVADQTIYGMWFLEYHIWVMQVAATISIS